MFSAFGDCCFSVSGPRLWNALPPHVKDAESTKSIQSSAKNTFF